MSSRHLYPTFAAGLAVLAVFALERDDIQAQPAKGNVMLVGSSGSIAVGNKAKEKAAAQSLKSFIKDETGMDVDIVTLKNWHELAEKMAKGQPQVGVFQGYEYAWATEKFPDLRPLTIAVNGTRYPVVYVLVNKDSKAKVFADLKGQTVALPGGTTGLPKLYLDRLIQTDGNKPDALFAKTTTPDNVEDALDDLVDGVVQAAVIDRAGLEAYKRRKPGRFKQLHPIAHSEAVLSPVIAYYEGSLDKATQQRFRDGLVDASRKDKGQTLLTLFRLTSFEVIPKDFDKVLEETRKAFPPEKDDEKKPVPAK